MNPLYLLLLTLPAAELLLRKSVVFWAQLDAAAIAADGATDSLGRRWHRGRWLVRAGLYAWLSVETASPLLLGGPWWWSFTLVAAAVLVRCGSYFAYQFNPDLSEARGLPKWYVSSSPTAARWPDRRLWQQAVRAWPDGYGWDAGMLQRLRVEHAAQQMEQLLTRIHWWGLGASGVLLGAGLLVLLYG